MKVMCPYCDTVQETIFVGDTSKGDNWDELKHHRIVKHDLLLCKGFECPGSLSVPKHRYVPIDEEV